MLSLKFAAACSLRLAASTTASSHVSGSFAGFKSDQTRPELVSIQARGAATATLRGSSLRKRYKELLDSDVHVPEPPKKPAGPWIQFCRSRISEFSKVPHRTASDTTKEIAREYRLIDKSNLEAKYARELEEYKRLKQSYLDSLTPEQRELVVLEKELKKEKAASRKLNSLKPPTRPRAANNFYFQERFKEPQVEELTKRERLSVVAKMIYADYGNLSDSERKKYTQLAEEDRKRFKLEFEQWYQGVLEEAKLDGLVRTQIEELRDKMVRLGYI